MAGAIERLSAGSSGADVADVLEADGCVIVEHLVDRADTAAILQEVAPHADAADPSMPHMVAGLAGKSPTFARRLVPHPTLLACCDRVLAPSCARYHLNLGHLLVPGPGSPAQVLHRDELLWHHVPRPHPELLVAAIVNLVEFTADLGATRVVPGSHRWERGRKPAPKEIAVAEMPPGSAVIYLGSTLHGAGANRTDRWRVALHMSYLLGWLRTEDNNLLSAPPRLAADLPADVRALLGYARHEGLGSVEGMDPADLFERGWEHVRGPVPALDGPEWAHARRLAGFVGPLEATRA
jgi:hypothetical protein